MQSTLEQITDRYIISGNMGNVSGCLIRSTSKLSHKDVGTDTANSPVFSDNTIVILAIRRNGTRAVMKPTRCARRARSLAPRRKCSLHSSDSDLEHIFEESRLDDAAK